MSRLVAGWRMIVPVAVVAVVVGTACTALAATPSSSPNEVSIAANGHSHAWLKIASGTPSLQVSVAHLPGTLIQVSTSDNAPVKPVLSGSAPIVLSLVHAPSSGARGHVAAYTIRVVLSSAVVWNIDFAGGTKRTVANLSGGKVDAIAVRAGSSVMNISLPKPAGTLPFLIADGVSQLKLSLPSGVLTRLAVGAGATYVTIGDQSVTRVASGAVLTPSGWTTATSRLNIDATAGVSRLTVSQR